MAERVNLFAATAELAGYDRITSSNPVDAAMNALVALASLFLLNTWATHRLFTTGAFLQRRGTFLAVTWLAPVMGALVALGEVRVHERELRLQRRWR
jgi:hypothetical protein